MLNINFVPDDYVENKESHRTNMMYLVLLLIVMAGLGGAFASIRIRQQSLGRKERMVRAKLEQAKEDIKKFEELQRKFKVMSKTALTTAELLEPVPRSVLLAALTNNLPRGVSLLKLKLVQKKPKRTNRVPAVSKYEAARSKRPGPAQQETSPEKSFQTHIDIEGTSPSDLEVAAYIEQLSCSVLLDNVVLVESKERKKTARRASPYPTLGRQPVMRQFKLKAKLKQNVQITSEDVDRIRNIQQGKFDVF